MIDAQTAAKRFFVERVVSQAGLENLSLSDAERRMLSWSESDPDYEVDPRLAVQLALEMSDEDYEAKIAGLLARSFDADVAADPAAADRWRWAKMVLDEGDHYILSMLDKAIGRRFKRWWQW